jgi:putative cell wall-binding protein
LKRATAVVAGLAISGATLLATAGPAFAVTGSGSADEQVTILNDANGQAAGDLILTLNSPAVDETVTITVKTPSGDNCAVPDDSIGFDGTPTTSEGADITVTPGSFAGGCSGQGVKDRITLKLNSTSITNPVTVSGIKYNVDTAVEAGAVGVDIDIDGTPANNSNAIIATVNRVSGDTNGDNVDERWDTAANLARRAFPCATGSDTVVIASGINFPDALAANYLAGQKGAAVLLTNTKTLPGATANALKNLGTTKVILVGGEKAIDPAVQTAIEAIEQTQCGGGEKAGTDHIDVTQRIAGVDRYDTARLVATSGGTIGTIDLTGTTCGGAELKSAILTSGDNFADALAAGPLVYAGSNPACGNQKPIPLILTNKTGPLNTYANQALQQLDVDQLIVLGGTAAIPQAAVDTAVGLAGGASVTFPGANRQDTAIQLAERLVPRGYQGQVLLARGDATTNAFPDALAAGQLGGVNGWPILLSSTTTSLGTATGTAITNEDLYHGVFLLGGTAALSEAVRTSVGAAFTARN